MIVFKNVSKYFGNIKAVENVSFTVEDGEFVFLTGPSGAGKTTILRLLLREYLPSAGDIEFDRISLAHLRKNEIPLIRQKIGVVFQDFKVLGERTIRENLEVPLAVIGVPEDDWDRRIKQIAELVGLQDRLDLFPTQLSGGELQRASLARALIVNPKVILADEPTGNLDWDTAESIMKLFQQVNEQGKTIIMATHNKLLIQEMKKRVIELKGGTMVNKPKEIKETKEEKVEAKEEIKPEDQPKPVEEKEREHKVRIKVEEVK